MVNGKSRLPNCIGLYPPREGGDTYRSEIAERIEDLKMLNDEFRA
jgi:hypothetical protein